MYMMHIPNQILYNIHVEMPKYKIKITTTIYIFSYYPDVYCFRSFHLISHMAKWWFGCGRLVTCRQGHSFATATGSPRTLCKPNSAKEAAGDPLVGRDLAGEVEDLPMQTMKIPWNCQEDLELWDEFVLMWTGWHHVTMWCSYQKLMTCLLGFRIVELKWETYRSCFPSKHVNELQDAAGLLAKAKSKS